MTEVDTRCRRPLTSLILLLAGAVAMGVVVGGSVVLGLCAVVYMNHR